MFKRLTCLLLVSLTVNAAPPRLPVRRILLYKHGVAYFERSGATTGIDEIRLEFKTSEMDDVLKSLTLIDPKGGRVSGVSYESSDPLEKQLQNYGFSVPAEASIGAVLDQFKGARITVKNPGGETRGAILGVRKVNKQGEEIELLALLLDGGTVKSVAINEATELKLDDERMQRDLASYLAVVAGGKGRDLRTLRIHPGTARELSVGYVVEAPVWKTSYRLVLDGTKPGVALLQGWAIVDNPTNEDWKDVEMSLVSGLPISFTQNLYQPHYMRRPEVALAAELAVAPRAYEGAMFERTELFAKTKNSPPVSFGAGSGGGVGSGRVPAGVIGGIVGGIVSSAPPPPPPPPSPKTAAMYSSSVEAETQGADLGELFEYRVDKKISIPSHESAMIPFLQTQIKAERVLLYDPAAERQTPFDALLVTNTSNLTLDGGAITVLDGDRYLGESLIENLKPGDSRPVSFAVDLGTRITTVFDSNLDQLTSVQVYRGNVFAHSRNVQKKTYTIRSTESKPRTLIVQHPVRTGWRLADGVKPAETTAQNYRFRVTLAGRETAKLVVEEESDLVNTLSLSNLSSDTLAIYVRSKAIPADALKRLEALLSLKDRIAVTQSKVKTAREEIAELGADQNRLRQNIHHLQGIPGQEAQVNSYASKLAADDKAIEALLGVVSSDRAKLLDWQKELDQMMSSIEI